MILWNQNHRQSDSASRFIYMAGPEKMNLSTAQKTFEADFLKDLKIPKDAGGIQDFIDNQLDTKYGPDAYATAIRKIIKPYITKNTDLLERTVNEAKNRYETVYKALKVKLAEILKKGAIKHGEVVNGIKEATKSKLSTVLTLAQKGNVVDRLAHRLDTTPKIRGYQVLTLVYALNEQYINSKIGTLKPNERRRYHQISSKFIKGMEFYATEQVKYIRRLEKDPKKRSELYKKLAKNLQEQYKRLANRDGIIDYPELKKMNKVAKKRIHLVRLLNQSKSLDDVLKIIEAKSILRPREFQEAIYIIGHNIINAARQNRSEGNLIEFAEKKVSKKNLSFQQAVIEVRHLIRQKAYTGAKQGIQFIQQLNKAVNKKRAEIIENNEVSPASIKGMILRERRQLLSGRMMPVSARDKIVVKFMRANRGKRIRMIKSDLALMAASERTGVPLKNSLFQAIQDIDKHYLRIYNNNYKQRVPKEIQQLKTRKNPGKPTGHDKIARLLALRTLAKEAKWIIKNYNNHPDLKKEGIAKKLDAITARPFIPKVFLLFRDPKKLYGTSYASLAARNGFTGKELLLTTAKVVGGLTILMNFMNYRREHGLVDGTMKLVTNPYMYAAGGLIYGVNRYRESPKVANYFNHTGGGQERLWTHSGLIGLTRKVKKEKVIKFVSNENEFNIMHYLMQNPIHGSQQITALLRKVNQRAGKNKSKPKITKEDLSKLISKQTLVDLLPDNTNDEMRYLFYAKFLTNKDRDTIALQNHIKTWTSGLT